MSIERCEQHGHWDTDFHEECPICVENSAIKRLFVSFSGGKSSAYMLYLILEKFRHTHEIVVVFANTGWEWEETLMFVERCSSEWKIPIIWVEAHIIHEEGKGTIHRIVNYETASRDCEPFKEMIKKYGIPNPSWPHCTRELKTNPMYSYIDSIWEKGTYQIAIGMRADEQKRRDKNAQALGYVYPLMDWWPTDKQDVNDWWQDQPFTLGLEEHQGNCKACWKKTINKHMRIIQETPEVYNFTRIMERDYGMAGANKDGKKRVFFRGHRSTDNLFSMAKELSRQQVWTFDDPDANNGCSEHCEAFGHKI